MVILQKFFLGVVTSTDYVKCGLLEWRVYAKSIMGKRPCLLFLLMPFNI